MNLLGVKVMFLPHDTTIIQNPPIYYLSNKYEHGGDNIIIRTTTGKNGETNLGLN